VRVRNITHKGLRRLYDEDSTKGIPAAAAGKLRDMLGFLDTIVDAGELRSVPGWKAHQLTGDRKGAWSLSVTRNWRLTFWIDAVEKEICDLDFENYH